MLTTEGVATLLPSGSLAGLMAIEGQVFGRIANHAPGRWLIRHVTHGGLARLGVRIARATGLLQGVEPIGLSLTVLRYYFQPFLEELEVGEDKATFLLNRCPYGWRDKQHLLLCDAVMELERELTAGIGADLTIEETIPAGAPKCRFTLRTLRPHVL